MRYTSGGDPGPWQIFVRRPDNIGLVPIRVKEKYLKESFLWQQQLAVFATGTATSGDSPGNSSGASGGNDGSENDYTDPDYIEDYYL